MTRRHTRRCLRQVSDSQPAPNPSATPLARATHHTTTAVSGDLVHFSGLLLLESVEVANGLAAPSRSDEGDTNAPTVAALLGVQMTGSLCVSRVLLPQAPFFLSRRVWRLPPRRLPHLPPEFPGVAHH